MTGVQTCALPISDFGTVQLHNDHLLVRGLGPCSGPNPCPGNAPAAPPPESTLPPILLPSAVVLSVIRSGSDLLPGCVVTERVVGFDGPAGACQWANGATISFSASLLLESERSVTKLPVRHLRRLMRRVVGLRSVIPGEGTPEGLSVDPIRNGDRVAGEPSRGNESPNVFLQGF